MKILKLFEAPQISWEDAVKESAEFIHVNTRALKRGFYPWSAQICESGSYQVHHHQTAPRVSHDIPKNINDAANSFFESKFRYPYRDNAKFCSAMRLHAKHHEAQGMNKHMCLVIPMGSPWTILFSPKVAVFEQLFSPDAVRLVEEMDKILAPHKSFEIWNDIMGESINESQFVDRYTDVAEGNHDAKFEKFIHEVLSRCDYQVTNKMDNQSILSGHEMMIVAQSYLIIDATRRSKYTDAIEKLVDDAI